MEKILVLTTWDYKSGLIQSSTLPYLTIIHQINPRAQLYLLTEEKQHWSEEEKSKAKSDLSGKGITWIPMAYHRFGWKKIISSSFNFISLWWLIITRKITHIHCFCTPAGAVGYLLSVLTGKKLVIDSYEPHAESMVENGTWSKDGKAFKMLWGFEKRQTQRAFYLIAAASGMKDYAAAKFGIELRHWGVRPACVDLDHFRFEQAKRDEIRKKLGWEDKIVAVYVGKFGGIYLDKEVFDFLNVGKVAWGNRLRVLVLTNHTKEEVEQLCNNSGFPFDSVYQTFVDYPEVSNYLSAADFALTPVKPVPSKKYCTPIKDGEYWAIGLPVVITKNISDDSCIIEKENAGAVLHSLDGPSYKTAIEKINMLLNEPKDLLRQRIRQIAEKYRNYDIARRQYEIVYRGESHP